MKPGGGVPGRDPRAETRGAAVLIVALIASLIAVIYRIAESGKRPSIVQAHAGRLWATADEGGGSTFEFTLPVQEMVRQ